MLQPDLTDKSIEEFWILLLNRANYLIKKIKLSSGGTSRTIVDAKFLFRLVLDHQAVSIILAHNHPSGNTTPSTADIVLTNSLDKAGKLLDIAVLDHIIFTDRNYFSFLMKDCFETKGPKNARNHSTYRYVVIFSIIFL